jgi:hypothetical protein
MKEISPEIFLGMDPESFTNNISRPYKVNFIGCSPLIYEEARSAL